MRPRHIDHETQTCGFCKGSSTVKACMVGVGYKQEVYSPGPASNGAEEPRSHEVASGGYQEIPIVYKGSENSF